jgi:hypothetical protein
MGETGLENVFLALLVLYVREVLSDFVAEKLCVSK